MELVAPQPIRPDLLEALGGAWQHIGAPGTWFTSRERLALAATAREAHEQALSLGVTARSESAHAAGGLLPKAAIAAARRIILEPGNLDQSWYEQLLEEGLTPERYVELVGVVATTCQLDYFTTALGAPRVTLPKPADGEPTRTRPEGVGTSVAWVPTVSPERATGELAGFYGQVEYVPYIIMAISLVPAETITFFSTHGHMYVPDAQDLEFSRSISRPQMERLAITVSTLASCLYCRESHESLMERVRSVWGSDRIELEDVLVRFASALTQLDREALAAAQEQLRNTLSWNELVDAAAIVAAFNAINRVANATGVTLDPIFQRDS